MLTIVIEPPIIHIYIPVALHVQRYIQYVPFIIGKVYNPLTMVLHSDPLDNLSREELMQLLTTRLSLNGANNSSQLGSNMGEVLGQGTGGSALAAGTLRLPIYPSPYSCGIRRHATTCNRRPISSKRTCRAIAACPHHTGLPELARWGRQLCHRIQPISSKLCTSSWPWPRSPASHTFPTGLSQPDPCPGHQPTAAGIIVVLTAPRSCPCASYKCISTSWASKSATHIRAVSARSSRCMQDDCS